MKLNIEIEKGGLDFDNQRNVVRLRDQLPPNGKRMSFKKIAERVRNHAKKPSCEDVVRRVYQRFNRKKGRVTYKFAHCGRKPWKMTKEAGSFIIKTLLRKRKQLVVTSTTLQADLYKDMKIKVSTSAVRKHLTSKGYRWRPRAQKRKYDTDQKIERKSFGKRFQHMSQEAISEHITLAMDGVVITVPSVGPWPLMCKCYLMFSMSQCLSDHGLLNAPYLMYCLGGEWGDGGEVET